MKGVPTHQRETLVAAVSSNALDELGWVWERVVEDNFVVRAL